MDARVRVYDAVGNPLMLLEGHQKGVISFSWTAGGQLISGSWDGTAKVWALDFAAHKGECVMTLGPHENGVQVLGLPDGNIATTSTGEAVNDRPANFKLRVWDGRTGRQVGDSICDHQGPIRGIATVAGLSGLATCSNDGTVSLRGIDGTLIDTMAHPLQDDGSPPFVLAVTSLQTGTGMGLVSCGEDGSVVVWEGAERTQSIMHPSSVWCAVGVPDTDGDFVTGGHDGVLRYFTRSADPAVVESAAALLLQHQFEEQVADMRARKRTGPSQEEINKQTRWELRGTTPGNKNLEVKVFNKDGTMIAAQWSADSATWVEIGEVTGNGDGGLVNGVQYDHVFPVEIETSQGLRNLNIGYNNMESPFDAAQRFIDQNGVNQTFLRQIADWIAARAGKNVPVLDMEARSGGYGGVGGSGSSSGMGAVKTYQCFPVRAFVVFDDIPSGFQAKVVPKIKEFNLMAADAGVALNDADVDLINKAVGTLVDTSHYHSSVVVASQVGAVAKIATAWPVDRAFPGFDLCRLLALHPAGSRALAGHASLAALVQAATSLLRTGGAAPTNTAVTALRFLANAFRHDDLRRAVTDLPDAHAALLHAAALQVGHSSKLVRLSAAALVLNCFVALVGHAPSSSTSGAGRVGLESACTLIASALPAVKALLVVETEQADAVYRALQALGTAMLHCKTVAAAGSAAREALEASLRQGDFHAAFSTVRARWGNSGGRLVECLNEVATM